MHYSMDEEEVPEGMAPKKHQPAPSVLYTSAGRGEEKLMEEDEEIKEEHTGIIIHLAT